jgi:hypothetical protein
MAAAGNPVRRAVVWLMDHWYVCLLFAGTAIAVLTWRRWQKSDDPFKKVREELDVIHAGSEARDMAIQLGVAQTQEHVREKYQAKLVAMDQQAREQVALLEGDPVALARYLERLSR